MIQSPSRMLGLFAGIVFLLVGLLGFFVATPLPFATPQGATVIGLFAGNGLLAMIHVIVGAVLLLAALGSAAVAKIINLLFGIGLVLFAVFGIVAEHTAANIVAVNAATTVLHLLAGLALAVLAVATDRFEPKLAAA